MAYAVWVSLVIRPSGRTYASMNAHALRERLVVEAVIVASQITGHPRHMLCGPCVVRRGDEVSVGTALAAATA